MRSSARVQTGDPSLSGRTPAMAAGIADHAWTLAELIALLTDAEQAVPMKRGPYKKRQAA